MLSETIHDIDLKNTDVVCIYGVDLRDYQRKYKAWLEEAEERYLIYFDENFDELLQTVSGRELLGHTKVRRYLAKDVQDEILKQLSWEFVYLRFSYQVAPCNAEKGSFILKRMLHYQTNVHLLASDYRDLGMQVMKNVFANTSLLAKSRSLKALEGKFKGIPAIICGAGPSLAKELSLLKGLSDKALIFAGGSALNVLGKSSITPHFCAHIDPEPPFKRFLEESSFEAPQFYQSRLSHEILSSLQGPLIWVESSGGYPIEGWISESLKLEREYFDGGWTVGNFCTALAVSLSCDPIIFVGMDFATKDKKLYAAKMKDEDNDVLIETKDIDGNLIYSKRDWIEAAKWMEDFAAKTASHTFFNAGQGGLGFQGIKNITLQDVASQFLKDSYDLYGAVHAALHSERQGLAEAQKIEGILSEIKASLMRCGSFCDKLLKCLEKIFPNLPDTKSEYVLLEFEMQEELAYKLIIEPIWKVWQPVFNRRIPKNAMAFGLYVNKLLFFKQVVVSNLKVVK